MKAQPQPLGRPPLAKVTIDGKARTVSEWSRQDGAVSLTLICARLRMGWPPRTAVFAPPAPTRRGAM